MKFVRGIFISLLVGLMMLSGGGATASVLSAVGKPSFAGQDLLLFKTTASGVSVTGAGGACNFGVAEPEQTLAFSASVTQTYVDLVVDMNADGSVSTAEHCQLFVTGVDFSQGSILVVSVESTGTFMTTNGLKFFDGSSFGNIPGFPRGSGFLAVQNSDTADQFASLYGNVETSFGVATLEVSIFGVGYKTDPNALPPVSGVPEPGMFALIALAFVAAFTTRRRASR